LSYKSKDETIQALPDLRGKIVKNKDLPPIILSGEIKR
jgi:hypothetical protein